MTYVTEQSPQELRAHMRRLQAMPGWHNPLDDRLYEEILALDAELAQLRAAQQPMQEGADCDQAFEDHYKTSSRDPSNAESLAIWRAAWGAKGADALAAIKAARAQALEQAKPALAEAAYDAAINYAQGREVDWSIVIEDAIRLLGEDAGRGESDLDDDGEPIKRCSVCGDPVRYGSRHHGCAPQPTQPQKPVAWMRHVRRHGEPVQCPKAAAGAFPVYVGDGGAGE